MKLEQQVVSLELAKKLKELGVKQESLFFWCNRVQLPKHQTRQCSDYLIYGHEGWAAEALTSAFNVAELGEMLPECYVTERRLRGDWECSQQFTSTTQDVGSKRYRENSICMFGDTEADARAKMLIYLLENGLVEGSLAEVS